MNQEFRGPDEVITEPVPGPEAFLRTDNAAIQSQAAILLLLGTQMRGTFEDLRDDLRESLMQFPIPEIQLQQNPRIRKQIHSQLEALLGFCSEADPKWVLSESGKLAHFLYAEPRFETVLRLLVCCLFHPFELVRVASASACKALDWIPGGADISEGILLEGMRSGNELVRDLSTAAFGDLDQRDIGGFKEIESVGVEELVSVHGALPIGEQSVVVHGTGAGANEWWKPGGDFHSYLGDIGQVPSDPQYFRWSGAYSGGERAFAAKQLETWMSKQTIPVNTLFAHSHGGTVAMLASQNGLLVDRLVLLSCPALQGILPDFNRANQVVSFRVHMDLVILGDYLVTGGRNRFQHSNIDEYFAGWFNHSATHEPATWEQYDLKSKI
jgi:pimeloyl-ACP methyl ester carboxylesterase